MKRPLRSRSKWPGRIGRAIARHLRGDAAGEVERLHAGQHPRPDGERSASLVLKGDVEVRRRQAVIPLHPGDSLRSTGSLRKRIRSIGESVILRLPRNRLLRIVRRWKDGESVAQHAAAFRGRAFGSGEEAASGLARVLFLLPLSADVPCDQLATICAETIAAETGEPVLRLILKAGGGQRAVARGNAASVQVVETGDGQNAAEEVERILADARRRFSYVLVEAERRVPVPAVFAVLRSSQAVYPILRQKGESLFELNLLSREAAAHGLHTTPLKPLVYLDREENAHGLSCYIEDMLRRPVHYYLRGTPDSDPGLRSNFRRLGREMCGRLTGLALSSGAARGLAHIGVIQVLEENGIEVDVVAGTSMGAYVAAIWGAGYDGHAMEQFTRELEGYRGLWRLMDFSFFPRRGFLGTERVRERLEAAIGPAHFSDMARPIRVVATRLDTLERVIFSGGNVVNAVLASIAIPGICIPVELGGVRYVDGGVCDPLPVDVLRGIGVRRIIAVNTIAPPETLRACLNERAAVEARRSLWRRTLNSWVNLFADGNAFDTIMRSMHAAQTRLAESACAGANVVLRPYTCASRWHDFGNPRRYIALGREAALDQLPAIKSLMESPKHEERPPLPALAHAA